jgi:N-methylhydantoinase B
VTKLDGARLVILHKRFEGIARKMANTLLRTGRSGVLNRARDFSCCILTADCELLSAAESLPIHVLSGPDRMARTMLEFHAPVQRGQAFLHNSPYHGCSHAADLSLLVPVLDDSGVHRYTVLAKAHQADIGNSIPTTYHGAARDVYEEGALIFPAVKVQENYRSVDDIVRMCEMRIRAPEQWRGDYLAMLGAGRTGERELLSLGQEQGWDKLSEFAEQWFEYSEARMAAAIRRLPGGRVQGISVHDAMPGVSENEIQIAAAVTIDAGEGRIEVDLRDNPDCLPCGLNVSEACARTSALIGVFNCLDHSIPKNAGSMRRVQVNLREGCIAGIPRHPYSCSAATTNVADRIANAVQLAWAGLGDGYGMAEIGAGLPPARGVFSGVDPRTGAPFVNQVFLGSSGGGASPQADGWLQYAHAGNGGMAFLDSVELAELYQPIVVHARRLLPDTEGAGRTRGAPSKMVEFGPVNCSIQVGYVSDGGVRAPSGARGGGNGGGSRQYRKKADGSTEPLSACGLVTLQAGESLISITCGGGGYGPPEERDPELARLDAQERWITRRRAAEVYRVAIREDGCIDWPETQRLRARY